MLEGQLLDLVYAAPDDVRPRLVWADWLEEQGSGLQLARAELVRLQCDPARAALAATAKRTSALQTLLASSWAHLQRFKVRQWEFQRGFPHRASMSAEHFTKVGTELLRTVPTLRAVTFIEASNELDALAETKALEQLREIDLSKLCSCGACPIEAEVERFVGSARLERLEVLSLRHNRLGPKQMTALARSPVFKSLRELDLSDNPLGSRGARELSKAKLPRLERLGLEGTELGKVGLQAVLRELKTLRRLEVARNQVSDEAAALVAAAGRPEIDCVAHVAAKPARRTKRATT